MRPALTALRAYRLRAADGRPCDARTPVSALFVVCSEHASANAFVAAVEPALVLQNLGARVPPGRVEGSGDVATMEYALQLLQVRHVVVVGHAGCGAGREDPEVRLHDPRFAPDALASQASLLLQASRARAHARASDRRVQVHALWFDEDEGDVYAYRPEERRFALLSDLDAERLLDELAATGEGGR